MSDWDRSVVCDYDIRSNLKLYDASVTQNNPEKAAKMAERGVSFLNFKSCVFLCSYHSHFMHKYMYMYT